MNVTYCYCTIRYNTEHVAPSPSSCLPLQVDQCRVALGEFYLYNKYAYNTPVTPNSSLPNSSERAQTVREIPKHSTKYLKVVQTT